MTTLLTLLFSISSMTNHVAPAGAQLHIRLLSTVGSYASEPGSPVSAVLIAPVIVEGQTIFESGSILSGRVKNVTRVGFGLKHETAGLDLEFNHLTTPEGEGVALGARVEAVDNGRERVREGRIQGVRSTDSMCYRVSGYIRMALQWEIHAELAEWAIRSLIMQLPEPEIYYPAGVELTLTLMQPLQVNVPLLSAETAASQFTLEEREELADVVAGMPERTHAPRSGRASDLTNVLFIGSQDQIVTAFAAAGWTQADPASLRGRINWIRAVAERRGDEVAPMSALLVNGAEPAMSWQKGLNDVSKRHHIRMWRQAAMWHGQEIWIGAATRDIDFAYLRPGRTLTHKIEENVDQERDKVAYDLAFTTCGNILEWAARPDSPRSARNATGDPILTDGRMVVIGLHDCAAPRLSTETVDITPLPEHGDKLQRFARREILSARNELIRTNPYWRTYEGSRWLFESIHHHFRPTPSPDLFSNSRPPSLAQSARLFVSRLQ